jgi:two-component system cell cycle response regulator DivK
VTLVLIVDDNEHNRKLEGDLLRRAGFETVESATGAEALALATERDPDVILMDLRLPDMDGAEVTEKLAADPRTARIPVLAISALPLEGAEDWLAAAGFAGWIEKPIRVDSFAEEIRLHATPAPGSR